MSTELTTQSQEEQELIAQMQNEQDTDDMVTPRLAIAQGLTSEVSNGTARSGEFVDKLAGVGIGTPIEVVVSAFRKGRFLSIQGENRVYRSRDFRGIVPSDWPIADAGNVSFLDHPEADETYRARVNSEEIEFGSGPKISTTWDFVLHVVDEDHEFLMPFELSLMRAQVPSARKLKQLLDRQGSKGYWGRTFVLGTYLKEFRNGNKAYIMTVEPGRVTTEDEKAAAVRLALAARSNQVDVRGDEDVDAKPAPAKATGAKF